MQATVTQYLKGLGNESARYALSFILQPIADRLSCQSHTSAALRIKGGSASPTVQSNAVWYGTVKGKLVTKATTTDMAALSGTVTNAKFNVFCFFIDVAGTLTSAMGVQGATLAAVQFPPIPEGKTMIGYVVINPTGTGDFVGGTTNLDDATVVPNAAFANVLGAFDPSILL